MAGGRPSKYDPAFCEMLIEHMAQGLSFESFAGAVRVSKQTLYGWADAHPEFLDAKSIGLEQGRLFWEKLSTDHAINEDGKPTLNNTAWVFNMKNRFGWRDKQPGEEDRTIIHQGDKEKPLQVATPDWDERAKQLKDK